MMSRYGILLSLVLGACTGVNDIGEQDISLGNLGEPPNKDGTCNGGLVVCGRLCLGVLSDAASCGKCGNACAKGEACTKGVCAGNGGGCGAGLTLCGNVCVDLLSDAANCGKCGNACAKGEACTKGVCAGNAGHCRGGLPLGRYGCAAQRSD